MKVGEFLKKKRLEKGLTMRDVCALAGEAIDKTTISRMEKGQRGISLKAGFFFSEIYGIDMKDIVKMEMGKKAKVKKIKIEKKRRGRPIGS